MGRVPLKEKTALENQFRAEGDESNARYYP